MVPNKIDSALLKMKKLESLAAKKQKSESMQILPAADNPPEIQINDLKTPN